MIDHPPAFEFCLDHRLTSNKRRHRIECLDRVLGLLVWTPLGDRDSEKRLSSSSREGALEHLEKHFADLVDDGPLERSSPPGYVIAVCGFVKSWEWIEDADGVGYASVECDGAVLLPMSGGECELADKHGLVDCPAVPRRERHFIRVAETLNQALWTLGTELGEIDSRRTNTLAAEADAKEAAQLRKPAPDHVVLSKDEIRSQAKLALFRADEELERRLEARA